jgi:sarcosine oxidase, subunit gamma
MSEPVLQSPLYTFGLSAQARPADESRGLWANEVLPPQGYIGLRGNPADAGFQDGAASALGIRLPEKPCTFTRSGAVKALWLAPDEWMIVAPRARLVPLLRGLGKALSGIRSQVVDTSGGYTEIVVQGRNVSDVISHASVYDLQRLGEGRVVGTTFGKSAVYMYREDNGVCLLVRRSFADYIWRFLVRAAEPYGFGVVRLDKGDLAEDAA